MPPRHRLPRSFKPAVSIKTSVPASELVYLDCGKRFKSLKRHLQNNLGFSPDDYRARWDLSAYPMVAPDYAETRSSLAKQMGLGQKGTRARKTAKAK
nr:MucR family transcriptional regulator [Rhizobium sp. ARZ01]